MDLTVLQKDPLCKLFVVAVADRFKGMRERSMPQIMQQPRQHGRALFILAQ